MEKGTESGKIRVKGESEVGMEWKRKKLGQGEAGKR